MDANLESQRELALLGRCGDTLCNFVGMDALSLLPGPGQGAAAALQMAEVCHRDRGDSARTTLLVVGAGLPDQLAGVYTAQPFSPEKLGPDTAAVVLRGAEAGGAERPAAEPIHAAGALLIWLEADLETARGAGALGFDLVQLKLPGMEPVGCREALKGFLPDPVACPAGERTILISPPKSIGPLRPWTQSLPAAEALLELLSAEPG